MHSDIPFWVLLDHLQQYPSAYLEKYLEKPEIVITDKEHRDPESRQSPQYKDRSVLIVGALNDLDSVSDECFDLSNRGTKSQ